jgi:hypothetical protein
VDFGRIMAKDIGKLTPELKAGIFGLGQYQQEIFGFWPD